MINVIKIIFDALLDFLARVGQNRAATRATAAAARLTESLNPFDPASVPPGRWAATLNAQEEQYWRVFGGIHQTAPGPAHMAFRAFAAAFDER